jgi:hypothetical protein
LNEGEIRHNFEMCAKTPKQNPGQDRTKWQGRRDRPKAISNRRLTEQIHKILGKPYASEFQV